MLRANVSGMPCWLGTSKQVPSEDTFLTAQLMTLLQLRAIVPLLSTRRRCAFLCSGMEQVVTRKVRNRQIRMVKIVNSGCKLRS